LRFVAVHESATGTLSPSRQTTQTVSVDAGRLLAGSNGMLPLPGAKTVMVRVALLLNVVVTEDAAGGDRHWPVLGSV
jgi:hypothetical protein